MTPAEIQSYIDINPNLLLSVDAQHSQILANNELKKHLGDNWHKIVQQAWPAPSNSSNVNEQFLTQQHLQVEAQYQVADQQIVQLHTHTQVDLNSQAPSDEWSEFISAQTQLHNVTLALGKIDQTDEILKQAVIMARRDLGIDRIGTLLYDANKDEIVGTWGTNEAGELCDEHDQHSASRNSHWVEKVLKSHDYVALWDNVDLKQWGKSVGKGWNAIAGMWDGESCIGWIACDNLLTLKPLEPWRRIILGQYAKSIASLIIQSQQKQSLRYINENLEQLVAEKNTELQQKVDQLEIAKDDLVESEKMASLGGLVAGVAHEINTPVGIGITAASFLKEKSDEQVQAYHNKTMRKSELANFFEQVTDSTHIILKNLNQAGELVNSFKKIAVDQTNDIKDDINLKELIDTLLLSFKHDIKNRPIVIINNVTEDIHFLSFAGRINQIISNLIKNSLLHAFDADDQGEIIINATINKQKLNIIYSDSGKGVAVDKIDSIFDPFYTTKRGQGGTGLGLNIIYNIINKMGGSIKAKNLTGKSGLEFIFDLKVERHAK